MHQIIRTWNNWDVFTILWQLYIYFYSPLAKGKLKPAHHVAICGYSCYLNSELFLQYSWCTTPNMSFSEWLKKKVFLQKHYTLASPNPVELKWQTQGRKAKQLRHPPMTGNTPLSLGLAGLAWIIAISLFQYKQEIVPFPANHKANRNVLREPVLRGLNTFLYMHVTARTLTLSTCDGGGYNTFSLQGGFSHSLSLG